MKKSLILLFSFLLISVLSWAQSGGNTGLLSRPAAQSVDKTVALLKSAIEEMGLKVIAEIDHGKAASKKGLQLRPTHTLLFGNPEVGTMLMQADQLVGLDLPLRMLAWENEQGKVFVSYHDPMNLLKTYQLEDEKETLQKMQGVLEKLAQRVGEKNK